MCGEVQSVKGWERFVRYLLRVRKVRMIVMAAPLS